MSLFRSGRPWLLAAAFGTLAFLVAPVAAFDVAPAPRVAGALPEIKTAEDLDQAFLVEIKHRSEIMKNLQHLSDVIGPRLTGSKNLERANNWTAERMKSYGLVNVHLEPWEIPVGWERGKATMRVIEPENGREVTIASYGWSPGTKGKVVGDVVVVKAKKKEDLEAYKGKLKNAVVLTSPPAFVAPVLDLSVNPGPDALPKQEPRGAGGPGGPGGGGPGGRFGADREFRRELTDFFKKEGVALTVTDSGKPHGLLNMTGNWPGDRGAEDNPIPRVFMVHEHYAMLWRLASRTDAPTKVEFEVENKIIPGPVTVFNTVGEVLGSEKPDEIVVVGAHLDSWDLGTGTTDNGTGSCVVLETARAVSALAAMGHKPKRTIRFILFTGEEEGLHGSKKYVERHKDELDKHSVALVHDTGTGKVAGFALHNRKSCMDILEPELTTLTKLDGWKGLDLRTLQGTDHQSFDAKGIPGFAARQDMEGYRLTHHSQSDTFDKAKEPNLIQGAQIMAITAMRVANLPAMLPRK
jgi:carboxypeptidase Q